MSLIEQALLRAKRPPGDEKPGEIACVSEVSSAVKPTKVTQPISPPDRRIVDLNSLRLGGYLPEEQQDRQFAEHYRQIKRPLIQNALQSVAGAANVDPRILMVTSALPGDGKTFTSINLAFSIARERDVSVLLVDADLPKPHVSRIFGLHREPGLLDALADENQPIESLVIPTNVRGFSILPAGTPSEGYSELLSSNRMRQIVKTLCTQNPRRLVLLDSPPLLITTEGRALVNVAGQVVLVVRSGITPRHAVQDAITLFDQKQAGGIVLNDAKTGLMDRYYGYGSYGTYGDAAAPKS